MFTVTLGNKNTSNHIVNCSRCVSWNYYGVCTLRSSCVFCNTSFPCKSRNQSCAADINVCVNDYTAFYNGKSQYSESHWIFLVLYQFNLRPITYYTLILLILDVKLARGTDPLGRIIATILIIIFVFCAATLCIRWVPPIELIEQH